jgi:hypothetical protein
MPTETAERPTIVVTPNRRVTLPLAALCIGLSEASCRKRMERGHWLEGKHWHRAPDGRIYIDLQAVDAWVVGD